MSRRVVIAGSGEHARVVAEAAVAAGLEPLGWTGPVPAPGGGAAGAGVGTGSGSGPGAGAGTGAGAASPSPLPRLGTDAELAARLGGLPAADRPSLVLGFGGPVAARRRVAAAFGAGATWATVVHPAAWVSPSATLGPGAVVLAHAVVNTGAVIGAHAIVNSGAIVEHDVVVGDHAHIAPGAAIGGGARIGEDAFIGLNATVRDHVSVGAGATVGMSAAVTADVPAMARVGGVPARPLATGDAAGLADGDAVHG
ncbi:MAG TPA: hypothetical protein VES19_16865 [Candidatus Limnocylindrales bacterium]|nr:hypothetical protein [Candidatus Limnocylindrales bacterium]